MLRRLSVFVALTLVAALVPAATLAQQGTGIIAGVVRDSTGGVLPGATVHILNDETHFEAEVVSGGEGTYQLTGLTPGRYRVEVRLDGFELAILQRTVAAGEAAPLEVVLAPARFTEGVVVTARRVEEIAQEVPIPVSVLDGRLIEDAGAFNVNRLRELIPTVQFYSTNPRNTSLNIRGLGSTIGLTNDGIEPGVGLYVDGVYFARPAATTMDFIDVERIEVLRGPQGTLFGKNTTAGAISITTRKPTFTRESDFELNYGNFGFVQAKGSISGPLARKVAARASFSGTQRDGLVRNIATQDDVNDLNNIGFRGQILITPSENLALTFAADNTRQRPEGYAQVVAGIAPTLRAANRQFPQIAADLGYSLPSTNPFARVIDTDTPWRSNQSLGGVSFNADWKIGRGTLTATSAWRYWDWDPSNDRDWTGLSAVSISQAPSIQKQWTQEVRYAGNVTPKFGLVLGFFAFGQNLKSNPFHTTEAGTDAWRYSLAPSANAATPGLVDGYGENTRLALNTTSSAVFGQLEWKINDRFRLLPGLRLNYDKKDMDFDRQVYGGLQTTVPALVALQREIFAPQAYVVDVNDFNTSGQLTAAVKVSRKVNAYGTYATSFKSVGLNLGGVPNNTEGRPAIEAASVKPERVGHFEAGIKTEPWRGATANLTVFNTAIKDFQAQVQNAQLGVQRGYLASADRVRVRGIEFDGTARVNSHVSLYTSAALTEGKYIAFVDAPVPLEETGAANASKDISGGRLPGISRWAVSYGGEITNPGSFFGRPGQLFAAVDTSYRSSFSSSPTPSRYLVVDGYTLLNARAGFRWSDGWTLSLWARNLTNRNYFEMLSPGAGGTGLYQGQLGDQRTVGVTLRVSLRSR